jgi:hypothetical protein
MKCAGEAHRRRAIAALCRRALFGEMGVKSRKQRLIEDAN